MSAELLVELIHASPVRVSLAICGAGAGVIRRLTRVRECSRTLLEANVLYHRASTHAALDGLPRHLVSTEAARQLAQHAFHTSRTIASAEARERQRSDAPLSPCTPRRSADLLFGVGATSAVKTSRSRHSKDQVHVCVWGGPVNVSEAACPPTSTTTTTSGGGRAAEPTGHVTDFYMEMPDWFSRADQDEQVELLVLHAIARTVELCVPAEAESTAGRGAGSDAAGMAYPRSLFHTLLPSGGDDAAVRADGASASSSSPGLSLVAGVSRLCVTPSESAPQPVCLDRESEVRWALGSVLSASATPTASGGDARDVCVLWNRHGELRAGALAPYTADARTAQGGDAASAIASTAAAAAAAAAAAGVGKAVQLLYPGSFNPLHYGHTELVRAATRVLLLRQHHHHEQHEQQQQQGDGDTHGEECDPPVEVTYELALKVVDKGAIEVEDMTRRVCQLLGRGKRVAVTAATLFVEKARLFPGHGFLIGIDTATRVLDSRHYSSSADPAEAEAAMVAALNRDIGGRGCYFIVGGRRVSDASGWQELSSLRIPAAVQHLFIGIPASEFRVDVSSTELRAARRASA